MRDRDEKRPVFSAYNVYVIHGTLAVPDPVVSVNQNVQVGSFIFLKDPRYFFRIRPGFCQL